MLMADTMAVFFVVLGLTLALVSLTLLTRGLWPDAVHGATQRAHRGLIVPFLIGIPVAGFPIVLAATLAKLAGPVGTALGAVILTITVLHAFVGVAGLATCIGERLTSACDDGRLWRATLRGAVVLVLSGLLPIIGWFVLLPAAFIFGSGAATVALFRIIVTAASRTSNDTPELAFGAPSTGAARQ